MEVEISNSILYRMRLLAAYLVLLLTLSRMHAAAIAKLTEVPSTAIVLKFTLFCLVQLG